MNKEEMMMKKIQLLALLCLCSMAVMAQKTITILHTNDTHSCIMPLNPNLADTLLAGRGGFLRRIAMLQEERRKDPDLLLFDSGDFSQGSPYYTLYQGDVEIELMNRMGYAASTVGNHEFDFGIENMARIFKKANFPILCTNYDFTGTAMEGVVKPYIILKRKGVKIGVFALDPKMDGLVDVAKYKGVKYLDPTKTALETATMLKEKMKCDLVICITHLGVRQPEDGDEQVVAGSRNIDLVLGGHSHTYLKELLYVKNMDGKPVPIDQNGKHGIFIGKIELQVEKK